MFVCILIQIQLALHLIYYVRWRFVRLHNARCNWSNQVTDFTRFETFTARDLPRIQTNLLNKNSKWPFVAQRICVWRQALNYMPIWYAVVRWWYRYRLFQTPIFWRRHLRSFHNLLARFFLFMILSYHTWPLTVRISALNVYISSDWQIFWF